MLSRLLALAILTSWSLAPSGAVAALSKKELQAVGFHLVPGHTLPLEALLHGPDGDLTLARALSGKPALLVFTDYKCQSLCGVVLDELATTLPALSLQAGKDYNVVSVALDSTQTQDDAMAFRNAHTVGSSLHDTGLFLTNGAPTLKALEASVGLVAPFDAQHKQFAHPAGLVLVDKAGKAQRILSPFAMNPFDLKLALTETGAAPASLSSRALLLCYGFDPATGVYTLRIERVMMMAAAATIVLIAGGVGALLLAERRRAA